MHSVQGGPNEEAIPNWETVQGQTPTTWVVSTRSNETISDGFFTIRVDFERGFIVSLLRF